MNYTETIEYLYSKLPMFTRIGSKAYKADLSNTIAFCKKIQNPQHQFKSIHVGGTNGKGSTSHMLAAILQTAGYKTGLYTSPHLRDFRERIQINGEMIAEESVIDFVNQHQLDIETIKPSFFETTVAMAFKHFASEQVDIAVIEVGLGGRLDSTNIIHPLLSIITNIGLDHTNILGDTLDQIATEKAGIIKPDTPVIIGKNQQEIADIFIKKAEQTNSKIMFANDTYQAKQASPSFGENRSEPTDLLNIEYNKLHSSIKDTIQLDLKGSYQLKNIVTVLTAIDELRDQDFDITNEHIHSALKQVTKLTGLMGRWQTLSTHPQIICDTGHNEDGISEVVKNIRLTPHHKLHMVFGMVKDKDSSTVLKLLPSDAQYYFCQPDLPRAKPVEELALEAKRSGLHGEAFDTVNQALQAAKSRAEARDLIFVGGSTFVVSEVI